MLVFALSAVVAAAFLAVPALAVPKTTECKGIKNCIDVVGPWVAVPAQGEATFLLQCPKNHPGTIGGVDSLASSQDVHVTFDGLLGGPVAAGTTTSGAAYFRGVSDRSVAGSFQPRIGCIPSNAGGRATTSARPPTAVGSALVLSATLMKLVPGTVQLTRLGCPSGAHFVSSWDATAFQTTDPPDISLLSGIHVALTQAKGTASVKVTTSEALPSNAHAEVQLGVSCAT